MARSGWVVGRRHAAGHERQGGWASAVTGVLGGSTAQAGWTRWCLAERVCCGPACRFAHTDANEGVNSGDRAKRILARWRPAGGERVHAVRGRRTAGQPRGRPITEPILPGFPDLGQNSFYEYGAREGVPRILDLLDKHAIKMTSFMSATPCAGTRPSRRRSSAADTRQARTAAAGSGNISCPARRDRADRRQRARDRAGHWHAPVRIQQLLDPARGQHAGDLAGARVHLSTTCRPTSRSCSRSTACRSPPSRTRCTSTTSPASISRLQPGRLRAADDRGIRSAVRRGSDPPPDDGHRPARAPVRARLPGPRTGPHPDQAARPRRRVVGPAKIRSPNGSSTTQAPPPGSTATQPR